MGKYFTVTPGQCLGFISTSTSTGYVSVTEMAESGHPTWQCEQAHSALTEPAIRFGVFGEG
jgi:hypothetical protein